MFSTAVRATIAERKLSGEEWLRVHREAHSLGIPTNCTMLYGHVETAADRIEHLDALRRLQDETGGFLTYIPLAYHPDNNELGEELGRTGTATTGYEDLRAIAVGRLMLDNIPHVKTHWPMVTPFLSQIALAFGCDDVEGTVVFERIYHEAGAKTAMHLRYHEIVELIRGAGRRAGNDRALALVGVDQPGEAFEQGRLASAVAPDQRQPVARSDIKVEPAKKPAFALDEAEAFIGKDWRSHPRALAESLLFCHAWDLNERVQAHS